MTGPTRKCAQRGNSVRPAPGPERPPGGIATLSGESAAVRPENGANTTFSGESAVYDASFVVIVTLPRPTVTSPRDALWKMRQRQAISRPENDALTRKRRVLEGRFATIPPVRRGDREVRSRPPIPSTEGC